MRFACLSVFLFFQLIDLELTYVMFDLKKMQQDVFSSLLFE